MTYEMKPIAGKSVLFVMAADAEYGVFLRTRISPLMTGVGPVEAAVVLTKELARLSSHDDLPDLVVSLGSAGSATLEQAEIYQVSAVSYRDMDASAFGFEKGKTPFLDLPVSVELPLRIPGIPTATLSTGANVVSGVAYQSIDAQMVDMETFAILRACQSFNIPLIGLRGISDGRDDVNHIDDWTQYLHVIDKKLALAVDGLQTALEDGVFWF
ncbi:5'-methylthioadenosine/S-adenosylhomocysteine nucleosidase [Allorhizobium sp. NPDC080224]|uniref:5'-methylthioadenosine/S-adenosylhomocysteine nucleosidase n=2 Tax=Rhizobium/Agrobacterium group TaxID=227290 RepID=A0ABX7EW82_9HYPH|nr:5'-methylthioadenosine/S-adenosylhomocysteine nucleosidase [Rhizobium rosettiformans]ODS57603.1 MAG: 5'-methylthioadenosine/S-adenosylhomocysteine nucleosidase [Agrobacterium sp. SCN 61-19]QRF51426.1 5'-methylthioadenosine/S-adenosylhomocysteine nucleosidase [Rhizobium rosettiformans]